MDKGSRWAIAVNDRGAHPLELLTRTSRARGGTAACGRRRRVVSTRTRVGHGGGDAHNGAERKSCSRGCSDSEDYAEHPFSRDADPYERVRTYARPHLR